MKFYSSKEVSDWLEYCAEAGYELMQNVSVSIKVLSRVKEILK